MATAQEIYAFRSQFSEFEESKDAEVSNALLWGSVWVDDTWDATDMRLAINLLAAHYLYLQQTQRGIGQILGAIGGSGGTGGASDLFVRSIGFGERRVLFGERGAAARIAAAGAPGAGDALLDQTIYGQMYKALRARNVAAVAVV